MFLRQIFDPHLSQYAYLIGCQKTGETISLSVAVVLHEGSTIVVVLNTLRLLARNEPAAT